MVPISKNILYKLLKQSISVILWENKPVCQCTWCKLTQVKSVRLFILHNSVSVYFFLSLLNSCIGTFILLVNFATISISHWCHCCPILPHLTCSSSYPVPSLRSSDVLYSSHFYSAFSLSLHPHHHHHHLCLNSISRVSCANHGIFIMHMSINIFVHSNWRLSWLKSSEWKAVLPHSMYSQSIAYCYSIFLW